VHIADAAAGVPAGGALDLEARRRATTVYLPELRVTMLPLRLVEARLTLAVGEPRDAVTAECRAGPGGTLEVLRVFRSKVRLAARTDYVATREPAGLPAWARPLVEVAEALRAGRRAAGARIVDGLQPHLRVRDGVPVFHARGGGAGDLVTTEGAVAHNRAVAEALRAASAPALWRVQDPPRNPEPDAADPLRELRARRSFAPARLSPLPGPHAGVGAPCYLQATSPIRRYADLVHQRQLAAHLEGRPGPHPEEELRAFAGDLAKREKDAHGASQDREAYWMAVLFGSRRGESFPAVCSKAPDRGRGRAWFPSFVQEWPFLWPESAGPPPAEGASLLLRPGRLSPHRGRVEFEPTVPDPNHQTSGG
jgi:exoribonuclease-2